MATKIATLKDKDGNIIYPRTSATALEGTVPQYWADQLISPIMRTNTNPTFGVVTADGFVGNLALSHNNEINFKGDSNQTKVYFAYRSGDTDAVSTENPITDYIFCRKDGINSYANLTCGGITSTGRIGLKNWIRFDDTTGLYWPSDKSGLNTELDFYPNNVSSYGGFQVRGKKGGYNGIHFGDTKNYMTIMSTGTDEGLYNESNGTWIIEHNRSNNNVGIRSGASSSYNVYVGGSLNATGTISQNGTAVSLNGHTHSYAATTHTHSQYATAISHDGGSLQLKNGSTVISTTTCASIFNKDTSNIIHAAYITNAGNIIPRKGGSANAAPTDSAAAGSLGNSTCYWGKSWSTNWATASDARLKTHIEYLSEDETNIILKGYKPRKFYWNDDESKTPVYGAFAQDVRDLLIENNLGYNDILCIGDKYTGDEIKDLTYPEENSIYSLSYSEFITPLIKGWQIHDNKIEQLEKEIEKLKEENKLLKMALN